LCFRDVISASSVKVSPVSETPFKTGSPMTAANSSGASLFSAGKVYLRSSSRTVYPRILNGRGTSDRCANAGAEIRKIKATERIPAEAKRRILRTCGIGSFALAVFQIEFYCVQNAVDELGGFECGKAPRDLES